MKQLGNFLLGLILMLIGAVVFLMKVNVNSFALYRYNSIPVGGIIILLMVITFIVMLVKTNIVTIGIFIIFAVIFLITLILSLDIRVAAMSALELVLILGLLCVGIALTIKGLFAISKKES